MGENACDDVFGWAAREPGRVTFARQAGPEAGSAWVPVTAGELAGRVTSVAAGLIAEGVGPGDRVGLLATTSLDWVICDFAIWAAGAVTVPLYETSSAEQIRWELGDSGAVGVFAGGARYADMIRRATPAKVEMIWELDSGGLDKLAGAGKHVAPEEIEKRRAAVTSGSPATIVYTSGTTGRPKGCVITHGNLTEAVRATLHAPGIRERVIVGAASSLFFLPLSHILARVVSLCLVREGKRAGYLASPDDLVEALPKLRPTVLLVVPRVLEKIAAAARQQAAAQGRAKFFAAAEATAIAWSRMSLGGTGRRAGIGLRLRHAVYDRLVYARLRAALGGQAKWVVSGAVTINPPGAQRFGSVGLPLPGCAVRVAADGEVEAQGPDVFHGYWQDPGSTDEAFDGRWFRTGDLGRLDDAGYLYLTGRKKELIITAGGKNVVPTALEDKVREQWIVAECVVVGDRRPYIAALVTLDAEAFTRWKQRNGKASATS